MAGSERSGLAAARADLFMDPLHSDSDWANASRIGCHCHSFWNALGARISTMTPRIMIAWWRPKSSASCPGLCPGHLVADTLPDNAFQLAEKLRDGTRVAGSDPLLCTHPE